jgi:hypothetical protein
LFKKEVEKMDFLSWVVAAMYCAGIIWEMI